MSDGPAPTRRARSPQPRGDETRRLILDETVACVLEEGASATSARRVAARAEVTWGVIQYHFGGRDGLLRAVVQDGLEGLGAALGRIAEEFPAADPPAVPTGPRLPVDTVVDAAWQAFSRPASLAALEILISERSSTAVGSTGHLANLDSRMTTLGSELGEMLGSRSAVALLWTCLRGMAMVRIVSPGDHPADRELRLVSAAVSAFIDRPRPGAHTP